jgi:hypothetical protein
MIGKKQPLSEQANLINCMRFVLKGRPLSDIAKDPVALKNALYLCKFGAILRKRRKDKQPEEIPHEEINNAEWNEGQESTKGENVRRSDCYVYVIEKMEST